MSVVSMPPSVRKSRGPSWGSAWRYFDMMFLDVVGGSQLEITLKAPEPRQRTSSEKAPRPEEQNYCASGEPVVAIAAGGPLAGSRAHSRISAPETAST